MTQDSGRLSQIEQMMGWGGVPRSRRRLYRFFAGVILFSGLCYCAGFTALALAPANRIASATATPVATPTLVVFNVTLPIGFPPSPAVTPYLPPTFTPSPSPTLTETATATPEPTITPTTPLEPAITPTPTTPPEPTVTLAPTTVSEPTATPTLEVTAEPPLLTYRLLLAMRDGDSLFVVNETATAFPLEPLQLGDGPGAIDGAEWGNAVLETRDCVTAWNESGRPKAPPGVKCNQVGARLTRSGANRFWRTVFNVYYAGVQIGTCQPEKCSLTITAR